MCWREDRGLRVPRKAQVDGSGSKSHTGILNRAAQGKRGWVSNQGVDLGGLGASVELGDPPLLRHPHLHGCWLLSLGRGLPSSPVGCFHSLQREDEGTPAGVLVLLLFPGRPPE